MGNAGLSLDKYRHDFISQQSMIQDAMIEGIRNQCTAILSELDDSDHLCPSSPSQQPHECASRVMNYLKSVFERLSFMPRSLIEVCQFTSCRHIAQYMQSLLADGEGSINILGVFNLNLDLLTMESFVEEFDTPDLVWESQGPLSRRQCFNDIHQLFSLLLSGRITDVLDDDIRNEQYPVVAMPVDVHGGGEE